MTLVRLAIRNLQRRPIRTALSIVGIALAVGSVLALVALSHSIEDSTRASLDEHGADLAVTQRGAPDIFAGFLPEELEGRIAAVPGVTRVLGELVLFAPSENDRHILASGWRESGAFWQKVPIREGRLPAAGERQVVLLGDSVAEALGKRIDDEIEILGVPLRVVGITNYASVVNRNLAIMGLTDLQEATYRTGQVTIYHVTLARGLNEADVARIRDDIANLGRLTVSMTREVLQKDRNFQTLNAVSRAISIIAMAMAVMNILNTLMMTIQERTREIGIVASIGWDDRLIMGSIVVEGLVMCAAGCMLGVALGYLASFMFRAVPTIGDYIQFTPSLGLIVPTILAAFVLCTIGALYPAWRAVRLNPAEALRSP
jgi:putative ABC transport system permease protein